MKRFLISLNTLLVSTSFVVSFTRETQAQSSKLVASGNRFDDIFLKDELQQRFNSNNEVVPMFKPNDSGDKAWHFLKSQTNQNKPHTIQSLAQNIFMPNNFIALRSNATIF